jgi:hypothetical protein
MVFTNQPMTEPAELDVPAHMQVPSDLEEELQRGLDEIERGEYVVLTSEQLNQWADLGVAQWPEEYRG